MAIKLVHVPATQQILVVTGYEGGVTAVHLLPKDDGLAIGVAQLLYLSQPHTQPILSLDILPDAKTYFTSGADAIVAAHRLPDLPPRLEDESPIMRTEEDEDNPPISIPNADSRYAPQPASRTVVGESAPSATADDPPVSIPDDNPDESLSFSKRPIEPSGRKPSGLSSLLSDNPVRPGTTKAAPRLSSLPPSIQVPYKINNTKHAGQQSLSVRSDGRLLVTGGWDSRIRIYSTKTLKELAVLKWHKVGVYAVAFAAILDASVLEHSSKQGESREAEGALARKETGISKLQKEREEKMQVKHWVAAGAKDGKVSLWEVF